MINDHDFFVKAKRSLELRTLERANETPCNHGNDSEKQIGMCLTLSTCLSALLPKAVLESMWFFPVLTLVLPFSQ